MHNSTQLAAQLMAWGADVDVVDGRNMTPLMHAAHIGNKSLVAALIKRSANVCCLNYDISVY